MKKTWTSLAGGMLATFLMLSASQAYVVVGHESEPFYFRDGSHGITGACHEIVVELCRRNKLACKYKIASIPKITEMLQTGEADISCPLAHAPEREESLYFSDRLFKTRLAFFAKPEDKKKIKSLQDLKGYSVSVFAPTVTSSTLHKMNKELGNIMTVVEEKTELLSLQKAAKIHQNLSFISSDIGQSWIRRSSESLEELNIGAQETFYYVAFSRKNISAEKMAQFFRSLTEMKKDGFIKKIAAKYGLRLPSGEDLASGQRLSQTLSSQNKKAPGFTPRAPQNPQILNAADQIQSTARTEPFQLFRIVGVFQFHLFK